MLNGDHRGIRLRDAYLFAAPIVCDRESVDSEFLVNFRTVLLDNSVMKSSFLKSSMPRCSTKKPPCELCGGSHQEMILVRCVSRDPSINRCGFSDN